MLNLVFGILARIFSNSFLNVFQKLLTNNDEKPSVINFYTYLGLTLLGVLICKNPVFSPNILPSILFMGMLGALGNYFIIKALSCGELSVLTPINSYKPVVALIIGIFMLGEYPGIKELFALLLIILGTYILIGQKFIPNIAYLYRALALIFSGTEAIFIKKIIIMTDISSAFLYWAIAGALFSFFFVFKHSFKFKKTNLKYLLSLIIMVGIMQYSTNYVFSRMNVSYALSIFQLSTIVSVCAGVNVFSEKGLIRKLIASAIMVIGAIIIIL